ncbi:MAG: hypothetical protein Q7T86_18130 [Hyphomicrobiaceae bacterium]|jgi:hypothetical protein|nr:hypothetical protein [Hyphomicrobiaceae bacterium]
MANTDFALGTDVADFDDLPRTLRRERESREREKREREARETRSQKQADAPGRPGSHKSSFDPAPSLYVPRDENVDERADPDAEFPAATVKRIDVPFFHMMRFYLKAVVAAVPALVLLTAICWGMGQLIKIFFPWLLKAQILIQFPN